MLLQAERRALEGTCHVERAVAILPAAVAERDHDLAFRHELAVEPGDALIAELLGHLNPFPVRRRLMRRWATGKADAGVWFRRAGRVRSCRPHRRARRHRTVRRGCPTRS